MITLAKAGLPLKAEKTGAVLDASDSRFDAAVVMSGVGPMQEMAEGAFDKMTLPHPLPLAARWMKAMSGMGKIHPWEWRMGAYRLTPPGDKYELVLDKGDHYLGGLICRENRGGVPDAEGVSIVNGMSTAFLDAYLKGDAEARAFLTTADVVALTRGRAQYAHK